MIEFFGYVELPPAVIANADKIKYEHYKVNTPAKFQVHTLEDTALMTSLSSLIGVAKERLDYVYFSVCAGAEPHTDLLDPKNFTDDTYVIPVILPNGESVISAEAYREKVHVGGVYKFNHTKLHSMELEGNTSGCVVIMVAVLRRHLHNRKCIKQMLMLEKDHRDMAGLIQQRDELLALLKRLPKVCNNMYVGRDKLSYGKQAKDLIAKIEGAATGDCYE